MGAILGLCSLPFSLSSMRQFYLAYRNLQIPQTVSGKLPPDPEVLKIEIERERQRLLEMKIIEE